ncbi:hypothetical protein ACSFBI_18055 [Variovorax sp. RB3P1]|uniref:hypothetical protein n=1 Tax=Variovorax sp. RB3P1 TaxID=3443732 RepID=UPI003F467E46
MPKPTRTAKQLRELLLERIEAIPDLRGQVTDLHRGGVVGTGLGGDDGPSWTIPVKTDRGTHRADIARIIRDVQMRYDLED